MEAKKRRCENDGKIKNQKSKVQK